MAIVEGRIDGNIGRERPRTRLEKQGNSDGIITNAEFHYVVRKKKNTRIKD